MNFKILTIPLFVIVALAAYANDNVEDQFSYEMDIFAGLNLHYRLAEKGLVIPALKGLLDKYYDNGSKDIYIL